MRRGVILSLLEGRVHALFICPFSPNNSPIQSLIYVSMDHGCLPYILDYILILFCLFCCTNCCSSGHRELCQLLHPFDAVSFLVTAVLHHFTLQYYKMLEAHCVYYLLQLQNQLFLQEPWFLLLKDSIRNQDLGTWQLLLPCHCFQDLPDDKARKYTCIY